MSRAVRLLSLTFALGTGACIDSTGGSLVNFSAAAAGPADAVEGQPLRFDNAKGFSITLTRARLFIGAVYLNRNESSAGLGDNNCLLPGLYVGEVRSSLTVDVLSPTPQPFPTAGEGTSQGARTGELWLTSRTNVNEPTDKQVIVDIAGVAEKGGTTFPFQGAITIAKNRVLPPQDPAQPGSNPICQQRIVSPIAVDLVLQEGGQLLIRVDPREWVAGVEFDQLPQIATSPPLYEFKNAPDGQPDLSLFNAIRSVQGVYQFSFAPPGG